jgi:hypothetical protein
MSSIINLNEGRVSGVYTLSVYKADGNKKSEVVIKNLITNQGINYWHTNDMQNIGDGASFLCCRVGTGTTPPTVTDTQVSGGTFVTVIGGAILGSTVVLGVSDGYASRTTNKYRFEVGVATGTWSEVALGVGPNTFSPTLPFTSLFSRALILDNLGDPTTISVLADEYLEVTHQTFVYPPLTDTVGTVTLAGNDYGYTYRAFGLGSVNNHLQSYRRLSDNAVVSVPMYGWGVNLSNFGSRTHSVLAIGAGVLPLFPATELPTNSPAIYDVSRITTSTGSDAYVNGNFYRDTSATWNGDTANYAGGIGTVLTAMQNSGRYQLHFDPPIPKTSENQLTLKIRRSLTPG